MARSGPTLCLTAGVAACAFAACGQAAQPAPPPLKAQPRHGTVVWAVGDGADGSGAAKRLAGAIAGDRPSALLYLGDVYAAGTPDEFAGHYQATYGALAGITWPTIGNHEYANRGSGYFPYWRRQRRVARPWYRVRLGGWELFSLNSEAPHGAGSPQLRWLQRRLSGAKGDCRLAFWHRPRFSAGTVHGDAPDVAPLWNALRGHARLVLNGHDHVMLRYRPRDGLTEYVSGAGGASLYGIRPDGHTAFSNSGVTGGLRITLTRAAARLEFRSVEGKVLDRSRTRCHPA